MQRTTSAALFRILLIGLWSAQPVDARAQATELDDSSFHREPSTSIARATVHARPGLVCTLHSANQKKESGLSVVTDDDGYARFYALRVPVDNPDRKQLLSCEDAKGRRFTYSADLSTDEPFRPHLIDLKREPGRDRPALQGDSMAVSQVELVARGYGLRPDPAYEPAGYAGWLLAASQTARMLEIKRVSRVKAGPTTILTPFWTGSILTGAPNYVSVQSYMNVPTGIPGGDGTSSTWISTWNGLGGLNGGFGIIQSGSGVETNPVAAAYFSWREYCCNDPNGTTYQGSFTPDPDDVLFVQNWYCDADGTPDVTGEYGCSFVQDLNSGALLNCTTSQSSPCAAARGLPLCATQPNAPNCMSPGTSAEFVIEFASNQLTPPTPDFPDLASTVTMQGFTTSAGHGGNTGRFYENVSTDPSVFIMGDFTNGVTRMNISLGSKDTTCFTTFPRQPPQDPPRVECTSLPLPNRDTPIDVARREELAAVILFGVIQDGGGVAVVGNNILHVPPRGPLSDTLGALPKELADRLSPLLHELPANARQMNALAAQLKGIVVTYRDAHLARIREP
jgi:hypothetical protein